ncbi:MAG: TIGR00730 family Rossman fold protein [Candidatus Pelagadaptatus aseana]|uniref:LOG family protein n=1 Tax=Candidatus Pelagadaptatus aseana TaxID=3120508 RepID=UPI0039B2781D
MDDKKHKKIFPSAKEDVHHALKDPVTSPQALSGAYQLAYTDDEFIMHDEQRGVRLQLELAKVEQALQDYQIEDTIAIFGSARLNSPGQCERMIQAAESALSANPDSAELQQRLSAAKRLKANSHYYHQARELARLITESCCQDGLPQLHVVTGGGPGIMEAANRGAHDADGASIGLNIVLPHEQTPNPYITPDLCFQFHYFALRKMHFLLRARALVVFPGGYGTLDELFETLTLVQTKKIKPLPILIFGREYWEKLINFDVLVEEGMISASDTWLFRYVDTAEEAWRDIKQYLLNHLQEQ